jgi:hypothetical protein
MVMEFGSQLQNRDSIYSMCRFLLYNNRYSLLNEETVAAIVALLLWIQNENSGTRISSSYENVVSKSDSVEVYDVIAKYIYDMVFIRPTFKKINYPNVLNPILQPFIDRYARIISRSYNLDEVEKYLRKTVSSLYNIAADTLRSFAHQHPLGKRSFLNTPPPYATTM